MLPVSLVCFAMVAASAAASTAASLPEIASTPEITQTPVIAPAEDAGSGETALARPLPDGLEGFQEGRKVVLDWAVTEKAPARFRILHPDGRVIATRNGRRSAQGWIASVRVAGWPRGLYLLTAEAGSTKSAKKFILR